MSRYGRMRVEHDGGPGTNEIILWTRYLDRYIEEERKELVTQLNGQ